MPNEVVGKKHGTNASSSWWKRLLMYLLFIDLANKMQRNSTCSGSCEEKGVLGRCNPNVLSYAVS